jgi:hypothetical protein
MSGLVSGITKIFSSLGTGAATLGSAVRAAGASLFTAGAATGTGLTAAASGGGALGGLLGGGSVLGNVLGGAIKQGLTGGLIGGIVGGISGEGFGKGFKQGGLLGAVTGGVTSGLGGLFSIGGTAQATEPGVDTMTTGSTSTTPPAKTPTGASPFGSTSMAAARTADRLSVPGYSADKAATTVPAVDTATTGATAGTGGGLFKGLGDFLNTNAGASMISGIGSALGEERAYELISKMKEDDRKFLRDKEQRITDSYAGAGDVVAGSTPWAGDQTVRPTPAAKWAYNPQTGMIDMTA